MTLIALNAKKINLQKKRIHEHEKMDSREIFAKETDCPLSSLKIHNVVSCMQTTKQQILKRRFDSDVYIRKHWKIQKAQLGNEEFLRKEHNTLS